MTTTETHSPSDVRTVLSGARRIPNPTIAPTQDVVLVYKIRTSRDFLVSGPRFDAAADEAVRICRELHFLTFPHRANFPLSTSEILAMTEALYEERESVR